MGNLEIFLRAVEEEKKKVLGAGTSASPTLCGLPVNLRLLLLSPPFLQQDTNRQGVLRIRTSCQNVQAFSANDGAIALDNEAGQWRLLQGNPEWLDGIFRKERFLCD